MRAEIVIAGGGVVGSSVAYWLSQLLPSSGGVLVCEPDPGYSFAASARSAGSIRQQFSTPINIALSSFGLEFLREAPARLGTADEPYDPGFVPSSYLYLADARSADRLTASAAAQRAAGVDVQLHDREALARRYPWLNVADIASGTDTQSGEGWFDGYGLLSALRRASIRAGVRYHARSVVGVRREGDGRLGGLRLSDGAELDCRWLVLAAGTRSRELAALVGIDLPVFPRKRNVFAFRCPTAIPDCPLVIDPDGLWFRRDGQQFLCGPAPAIDRDVSHEDFELEVDLFEDVAWPTLARRVPAFEQVRLVSGWVGHYDFNAFDQNAFVGPCGGIPGVLLAGGFSGHGLQQAAGVGRGIAEYICYGGYRSLDLTPLSHERYLQQMPLTEHNVI
jgi:FAD-dependent oxidoreductase domain-containing protein 1